MNIQIPGKLLALPMISLCLGSSLVIYPHRSQAQNYASPLPNLQPMEAVEFYQYEQNLQPYQQAQSNQYSQNFERYLVFVDTSNSQVLQQVRWVDSEAFIRQYEGRSVIQSGIFSQRVNAENRVRELQSYGISNVRLVSFTDGRQIPFNGADRGQPATRQASAYYAVIPGEARELSAIANDIRSRRQNYNIVQIRQQPLGPHIAVGPFSTRRDAEEWNQYLRNIGYGNSRVHYGK